MFGGNRWSSQAYREADRWSSQEYHPRYDRHLKHSQFLEVPEPNKRQRDYHKAKFPSPRRAIPPRGQQYRRMMFGGENKKFNYWYFIIPIITTIITIYISTSIKFYHNFGTRNYGVSKEDKIKLIVAGAIILVAGIITMYNSNKISLTILGVLNIILALNLLYNSSQLYDLPNLREAELDDRVNLSYGISYGIISIISFALVIYQ